MYGGTDLHLCEENRLLSLNILSVFLFNQADPECWQFVNTGHQPNQWVRIQVSLFVPTKSGFRLVRCAKRIPPCRVLVQFFSLWHSYKRSCEWRGLLKLPVKSLHIVSFFFSPSGCRSNARLLPHHQRNRQRCEGVWKHTEEEVSGRKWSLVAFMKKVLTGFTANCFKSCC